MLRVPSKSLNSSLIGLSRCGHLGTLCTPFSCGFVDYWFISFKLVSTLADLQELAGIVAVTMLSASLAVGHPATGRPPAACRLAARHPPAPLVESFFYTCSRSLMCAQYVSSRWSRLQHHSEYFLSRTSFRSLVVGLLGRCVRGLWTSHFVHKRCHAVLARSSGAREDLLLHVTTSLQ